MHLLCIVHLLATYRIPSFTCLLFYVLHQLCDISYKNECMNLRDSESYLVTSCVCSHVPVMCEEAALFFTHYVFHSAYAKASSVLILDVHSISCHSDCKRIMC